MPKKYLRAALAITVGASWVAVACGESDNGETHTVTVHVRGAGEVRGVGVLDLSCKESTCGPFTLAESELVLRATPGVGSRFAGWTIDASSADDGGVTTANDPDLLIKRDMGSVLDVTAAFAVDGTDPGSRDSGPSSSSSGGTDAGAGTTDGGGNADGGSSGSTVDAGNDAGPDATASCNGDQCSDAEVCCYTHLGSSPGTMACESTCSAPRAVALCGSAYECGAGNVCCIDTTYNYPSQRIAEVAVSCTPRAACVMGERMGDNQHSRAVLCAVQADCANGLYCTQSPFADGIRYCTSGL